MLNQASLSYAESFLAEDDVIIAARERAAELGEDARQIVHPLQRQVAPHEVDGPGRKRQATRVAADQRRIAAR